MAKTVQGIIPIPGTEYGFKWDTYSWELARNVKGQWKNPTWHANFAQMAEAITRSVGAGHPLADHLREIVTERARLEAVVKALIEAAHCGASCRCKPADSGIGAPTPETPLAGAQAGAGQRARVKASAN